jgi:hypothetical protein
MPPRAIEGTPDFQKLMQTVAALRAHYSTIAGKAERAMIAERMRGNRPAAQAYKDALKSMHDDHKAALDLIAEELTTPEQLSATRRFLRTEADEANRFVRELQQIEMTLGKIAEVVTFMGELVRGLTSILR